MNYLFLIFFVMFHSSDCLKLDFSDCGAKEVKAVRSTTCKSDPCRVPIGGDVSIEVDFVPKTSAQKATIGVFASLWGFELSLDLDDTDACAEGRLQCPLKEGAEHTLKYHLKIKDDYMPVSGDVGFRLLDESGNALACATISAELYAAEVGEDEEKHKEL